MVGFSIAIAVRRILVVFIIKRIIKRIRVIIGKIVQMALFWGIVGEKLRKIRSLKNPWFRYS